MGPAVMNHKGTKDTKADRDTTERFDAQELMELLRGLEQRGISYYIEHRRTAKHCDGIAVRIHTGHMEIWEVGFFEYGHIEVLK